MRRKQHEQQDSLEMLLDTMCNAFGGIILIAILIAIMARPQTPDGGSAEEKMREFQINQLNVQLDDARAEYAELSDEADKLDPAVTNLVSDQEALMVKVSLATNTINNLNATPEQKKKTMEEVSRLAEENKASQESLSQIEMAIEQATAQLNNANEGEPVTVRAPRGRGTKKKKAFIIIKDGKFWAMDIWQNGIRKDNDLSCRIEKDQLGRPVRQVPIPEKGVPVARNEAALQGTPIELYLRTIPKNEYFIMCFVHQNSFSEFRFIKEILIKKGIQYNWSPSKKDLIVLTYGAASPNIVQ